MFEVLILSLMLFRHEAEIVPSRHLVRLCKPELGYTTTA